MRKKKTNNSEDTSNEVWRAGNLLERQIAVRMEEQRVKLDLSQKDACAEAFPWVREEESRPKHYSNIIGEGKYRDKPARITITHLFGIARFLGTDPHTLLAEVEYDIRKGDIRPMPDTPKKAGARKRAANKWRRTSTQPDGPQLKIL